MLAYELVQAAVPEHAGSLRVDVDAHQARAVATLFTAGYAGVSIPVVGVGIVLQHLSPLPPIA